MNIRSIVGLLLALVLQVSLAVPTGACVSKDRCEMQASSCSCCNGQTSCPCAKNSKDGEKPRVPVAPPADPLKVDAVLLPEVVGILPVTRSHAERAAFPDLTRFSTVGYSGVGLPVSFCRLII